MSRTPTPRPPIVLLTILRRLGSLVRLGRPWFLLGGFVLHALGAAMALASGATLKPAAYLWGQLAISSVQLMTHYSNEYFDLAADRANPTPTRWAGGSRILTAGIIRPRVALATAGLFAALGLVATLVMTATYTPAWPLLALLVPAFLLALGYSAPPLQLHSRGLGEATVALVVAVLTPLTGFVLQSGRLDWQPVLAVIPLVGLQFAMMLVLEFPDAHGDASADKRTLVVCCGPAGAARLHNLVLFLTYASLPPLTWLGLPWLVAIGAALPAPVALWHGWRVARAGRGQPSRWDSLSFWAIGLFMATTAAELAAFLWLFQKT